MKKLALTLLMTALTTGAACLPAFAAETMTYNGGHIYQAQAGKPGTIQIDISNVDSQKLVKMTDAELMEYLDADGTIDKIIYTDEVGKGYSIRSIVQSLNSKDGVPVYTSSSAMPTLTAKTAMTAFMSFWKGDDSSKVAFAPKFYLQNDFLKTGGADTLKIYDAQPTTDWIYAPGTAEKVTKAGKYLFVVHDNGGIDGSPLSIVCVNVGANNATTSPTVTPTPAPPTANPTQPVGWVKADNVWRYYDINRVMKTGWLNDSGVWYYLNSDGAMKTGWLNDNGTWYYLNANGSMATNTTIDGYTLDASGAWIN